MLLRLYAMFCLPRYATMLPLRRHAAMLIIITMMLDADELMLRRHDGHCAPAADDTPLLMLLCYHIA